MLWFDIKFSDYGATVVANTKLTLDPKKIHLGLKQPASSTLCLQQHCLLL